MATPVRESSYKIVIALFSCMLLGLSTRDVLPCKTGSTAGHQAVNTRDRQALIVVLLSPLSYMVYSLVSFHHCRVVDKIIRSRTWPETATFSPNHYHKGASIPTRLHYFQPFMTAPLQAVPSFYQEPVSRIRNPNFFPLSTVQI